MNKISWFLSFVTISVVMTFLVSGLYAGDVTIPANPNQNFNNIGDALGLFGRFFDTYMKIILFQVTGLPPLFNVFFLIMNIGTFYLLIDLLWL